jgi:ribonuclease D
MAGISFLKKPTRGDPSMNRSFLEVEPRNFKPMAVPGLEKEVRDAVNAALKAMSSWRNDIADTTEYNGKRVIEKMAAAAAALGWPEQIVDAARVQMQSIAEMQIQTMDHLMDAWEEQLKLPNPTDTSLSAMLSKLKSLPGFAPTNGWQSAEAFQKAAMNPLQFWMQFAAQWQKSWADTMTFWRNAGKLH